jgi:tetrathionate reductase subunit C
MNGTIVEIVNVTRESAWLPWAVQYFFLIGLSLGGFLLTLPAFVGRREAWLPLGRVALIVAVTCGIAAPVALLADLHQPNRFWHFYAYPQDDSWMSFGAWLIPFYVGLLLLYAWGILRPNLPRALALGGSCNRFAPAIGVLTALLAAGVAAYTGIEVAVVKARPLWNTPLLPVQFLATALVGGLGLVLILNRAVNASDRTVEGAANRLLAVFLALVMVLGVLWFALGFLGLSEVHARALASVAGFDAWQITALWAAAATLVPLAIALRWPVGSGWVTGLIAVHSAWMFRWTVFMGGQSVPKTGAGLYDYTLPLGPEGLLGIVGTLGLWIFLAIVFTSLLPWRSVRLPARGEAAAMALKAKEN